MRFLPIFLGASDGASLIYEYMKKNAARAARKRKFFKLISRYVKGGRVPFGACRLHSGGSPIARIAGVIRRHVGCDVHMEM